METSTPHSSETSQVIMMKLCPFNYVFETNTCAKFGWNPPAPRIREIYSSCDFSSCLPAFLPYWLTALLTFFLRTCKGQSDRANFTHNGSKDAVWRKEVPSQQVFLSHLTFWGLFCPNRPKISPPVRKSQPNKKSRITSKPFKIDKNCQLNMNIKSGSPFRIRNQKLPEAPLSDEIAMTTFPANIKSYINQKWCTIDV